MSQLLWAHAHLGHASPALVAAVYNRLETAEVATGGSSSSSAPIANPAPPQPLVLANMSAASNLCYALAKLGRPPPACVGRLAAVLLAEAEAAEEAAEEASLQLEGHFPDWGMLDSAEDEEAASAAAGQQSSGSSGSSGSDGNTPTTRSSGQWEVQGISLAACDPRGLCLLMWTLAELGACPPALLRHTMASLRRRRGLVRLSMQSMAHVLLAAQRLAAAPAQLEQEEAGQEQQWGAPVLSGAQRERRRQEQRFRWDQAFMDAVAAELARRAKHVQRQQHGQRPPRPFHLNDLDCSTLARAFAAAWQEAAAASGAATGEVRAKWGWPQEAVCCGATAAQPLASNTASAAAGLPLPSSSHWLQTTG